MDEGGRTLSLREVWRALRGGWRWVLGVTTVLVAAAALVTRWVPPTFQSETLLQFNTPSTGGSLLSQLTPLSQLGLGAAGDEMDTQIGILSSRRVAGSVVDSLALDVMLVEPRAPRDSVLRVLRAPRQEFGTTYALSRTPGGSYEVRVEEGRRPAGMATRVELGAPFRLGDMELIIRETAGDPPPEIRIQVDPHADIVDELREAITVSRERGASRLVSVSFRSRDRWLAAEVPNVAVATLIRYQDQTSTGDSRQKAEMLRDQVLMYSRQLHDAEERLRRYSESAQVVQPETQASAHIHRLSAVLVNRDALQVERDALNRLLEQVRTSEPGTAGSTYRRLATFPAFVANSGIQNILESLVELETERAELLVRRTPESRDVRGIDARIADLEDQLHRFGTSHLRNLHNQVASADGVLEQFDVELSAIPAREIGYLRLKREVELLNGIYAYLQTSQKEAEIKAATEEDPIHVVDAAPVPRNQVSPKPLINLGLAGFMGLLLGGAIAVGRRLMDTRVHHLEEVEAAAGVRVLEVIPVGSAPSLEGSAAAAGWGIRWPRRANRRNPLPPLARGLDPAVLRDAEGCYHSLWLSLVGRGGKEGPAVVQISSTSGSDGKSTTAASLAVALARRGRRTLLIDGDLREGVLHWLLGAERAPGLAEVLAGEARLEDVLRPVDMPDVGPGLLLLLPRGRDVSNAAELLASQRMRDLLREVRAEFGAVVVDTPPINRATDGLALRNSVDAMLLVAQTGATEKQALVDASRRIRQFDADVHGIVLNTPGSPGNGSAPIRIPRFVG